MNLTPDSDRRMKGASGHGDAQSTTVQVAAKAKESAKRRYNSPEDRYRARPIAPHATASARRPGPLSWRRPMRYRISAMFLATTLLAAPSVANPAFVQTSVDCLRLIDQDLEIEAVFPGSDIHHDGGIGESEVFVDRMELLIDATIKSCIVLDPTNTKDEAEKLLSEMLEKGGVANVHTKEGFAGSTVTRGNYGIGVLSVYVDVGLDGGAAYLMSIAPAN